MGDASAYESLGLEPGADQAAIERAYKRLIKEHHPDRQGGDPKRATEINRAYRELREDLSPDDATLELNEDDSPGVRGLGWTIPALVAVGGVAAVVLAVMPISSTLPNWSPASAQGLAGAHQSAAVPDAMDAPLQTAAIDAAVGSARHIAKTADEMGLAAESSDCHRKLRSHPDLLQLDRCAAFDDAVVELQDRDPLRDRGPFSELAVTGRQWSGAAALSNDYLAIDGRLDRIRLRVELALAESEPPVPND